MWDPVALNVPLHARNSSNDVKVPVMLGTAGRVYSQSHM